MSDTETTTTTLDKRDILALRTADDVTFHYWEGRHCVRAHKRGRRAEGAVWASDSPDEYREIAASGGFRIYERNGDSGRSEAPAAFHMIHGAKYGHESEWQTIASLLKVGDTLHLAWVGSNNSDNTRSVHHERDELRLIVKRGDKRLTFLVAVQVGPDDSARMVHVS